MRSDRKSINIFFAISLGVLGVIVMMLIKNETIAAQLVIAIAFTVNIIAIYSKSLSRVKEQVRCFTAYFLFGALMGSVFA